METWVFKPVKMEQARPSTANSRTKNQNLQPNQPTLETLKR